MRSQLEIALEEEISAHEFTRLQLEDEMTNVTLSLETIRKLQAQMRSQLGTVDLEPASTAEFDDTKFLQLAESLEHLLTGDQTAEKRKAALKLSADMRACWSDAASKAALTQQRLLSIVRGEMRIVEELFSRPPSSATSID